MENKQKKWKRLEYKDNPKDVEKKKNKYEREHKKSAYIIPPECKFTDDWTLLCAENTEDDTFATCFVKTAASASSGFWIARILLALCTASVQPTSLRKRLPFVLRISDIGDVETTDAIWTLVKLWTLRSGMFLQQSVTWMVCVDGSIGFISVCDVIDAERFVFVFVLFCT